MTDLIEATTEDLLDRTRELALKDPTRESDERWEAIRELHARGDAKIFKAAQAWCSASEALLRSLGADVMGQLGYESGLPYADASEPFLQALLSDTDARVVAGGLVALGHLARGSFEVIQPLATHSSERVREAVAYCLGGREEEAALTTLIQLSTDQDRDTRNWAAFGLGSQCEADRPDLRDALAALLTDEDHEIRGEAMVGLATRKDERARAAILNELQMDDVSDLSIEAAALLPDAGFIKHLEVLNER
ncbi:MAG: HEAT repeat protein, partial [Planctomycetota bacterium]